MPSVPLPSAPSTSGAATSPDEASPPAGATRRPEQFELPDLCTPLAVFGVVLATQLLAVVLTLARQPGWWAFYTELAPTSLLLLWFGLVSAAVLCRLRLRLQAFGPRNGSLLALALVLACIGLVSEGAWWLGRSLGGGGWFPADHWAFLTRNLALGGLVAAGLLRYFYVSHQWQQNVRRQAELRLNALQARIRPHFLFNSMNTIAALTRSNPAAAEQAVEDLADLFRASLQDGRQRIPLREELDITRVYERMEQHRLGDRLRVDWQLGDLPLDAAIPGLTIQPLLENAIYHGIEPAPQPGVVTIGGESDDRMVRISVTNPLPPPGRLQRRAGNRIALDNIRERLALAFGPDSALTVGSGDGRFTVTISFPRTPVREAP